MLSSFSLSFLVLPSLRKYEILWETREFWRQNLERREVIQFMKKKRYMLKVDGHSFYSEVEEHRCSRYGLYKVIKKDDNGEIVPSNRVCRESMKVGCPATLNFKRLKHDPTKGHAFYNSDHKNHEPRQLRGLAGHHKSKQLLHELRDLVDQGVDRDVILARYSINPALIQGRINSSLGHHRDDVITREDVNNLIYELTVKKVQLDSNDFISLDKAADAMRAEKYLVYTNKYESQVYNPKMKWDSCGTPLFAFGFMHPWQQQLYKKYGGSIGLDSTHNTTRYAHSILNNYFWLETGDALFYLFYYFFLYFFAFCCLLDMTSSCILSLSDINMDMVSLLAFW